MTQQADVAAAAPPATTAQSPSPSPRDRIIAHMNSDHQRELSLYLRHYAGLGHSAAATPWLKDVTLEGMNIAAGGLGGKEYHVAFDPALDSWADVRPAVVEMARVSRRALGLSDVAVTHFAPPQGFDVVVFGSVAFYFVCWLTLGFVLPGTPIWSFLQAVFPGGPRCYRWLVKAIFLPVLAIHLTECYWFHRTRLQRHGIEAGTGLWWTWIGSLFFEGVCGFMRFDAIVAAKKKENEGKSH
ncbi:Putative hem oxygenase HugZ-like superfamily [Colletotrichum destructivum]|uniref:Hem oxygenase HugZ-like superfamily n=1 Tax=Colletotrichum destructivum TaxID=34406 RepID=A0AAX4IF90_9PEZI|nr:Putative hem oxygenase HugZ-like superfamily [Colletotrichum destructivum]